MGRWRHRCWRKNSFLEWLAQSCRPPAKKNVRREGLLHIRFIWPCYFYTDWQKEPCDMPQLELWVSRLASRKPEGGAVPVKQEGCSRGCSFRKRRVFSQVDNKSHAFCGSTRYLYRLMCFNRQSIFPSSEKSKRSLKYLGFSPCFPRSIYLSHT